MSDKVKLPKEVAEAIELMKAKGSPLNEIVERHVHHDHIQVNGYDLVGLLPTDTLIRALYIGYEVEQTPEDKVRDYYNHCLKQAVESTDVLVGNGWRRESCGVRNTLILLNIKIQGVNAE